MHNHHDTNFLQHSIPTLNHFGRHSSFIHSQRPKMSSIICSVCHDTLFLSVASQNKVSSAKCGHLFHTDCIEEIQVWAEKKESRRKYLNCCPSCQVNVGEAGFILLKPKFPKVKVRKKLSFVF